MYKQNFQDYIWMNEWRFFKIKEKLEAGVHIVNK